jgi:hypothetical protein
MKKFLFAIGVLVLGLTATAVSICLSLCEMRNFSAGQVWAGAFFVAAEPSHAALLA